MGCEVLWSRELIPLVGNSTYAFALLLAAYLGGLGLGSCLRLEAPRPWESFAALLAALGAAIALSAASTRFVGIRIDSPDFLYSPLRSFADFPLVAAEALVFVFPSSLILGLLFPVALSLSGKDGAAVGRLYAWNTLGGIAGSLLCGFAGIAVLGSHASLLALAGLALAGSVCAAAHAGGRRGWAAAGASALLALAACAYARLDPALEILAARLGKTHQGEISFLFHDESPAATITGTVSTEGGRTLLINGIETSAAGLLGALMELLPNIAVPEPRSTLVICFGVGNTFRAASLLGGSVDAVELVGDVVRRMPFFHPDAAQHLAKTGNAVFIEDGRSYLLRTAKRYDVIVIDAAPPLYSAGAVNLYTREFLTLARGHLTEQGALALWLPTLSFESDYWQILRGFSDSFEHVSVWEQPLIPGFLVIGSAKPRAWPPADLGAIVRRRVPRALRWEGLNEGRLRMDFWLSEADLRAFVSRFEPVTDDRPTVEFPLARFWRGEPLMRSPEFLRKAVGAAR